MFSLYFRLLVISRIFKNMTEVEGMADKHFENEEQPFK